jgi:hypothetical protein
MNEIVIRDPERLQVMIDRMAPEAKRYAFARAFLRLIGLCTRYLTSVPEGHTRQAVIWATERDPNDFYFQIMQYTPPDPAKVDGQHILTGTLHYHESDDSWGIHT